MPSNNKPRTKNNQSLLISSSVFGVLLVATLASGAIMANTRAHADTSEVDTVNVDITAACTMTRTDSSGGTYATSLMPEQDTTLGPTSIKTICNDSAGYSIYAIGYSGNSYTNTNHTDLISTIDNSYNIHTYAPSSAGSNSYWSMKVEPVASGAYTPTVESAYADFNVIPGTFTKLVGLGQATDAGDGATGSNINATYKIKASTSQVAGTYTGKVKYTLVHPNTAPAPTIPPDMQNTAAVAALLPNVGDTATVRDSRDGKEYTVAKLADNNIWMTQNLAIEPGTHMTEADTQITSAQYNHEGYYALPGEGYDLRTDGTAASETSTGNCNSANNAGYINACTHMADSQDIQDIRDADTEGVLDYTNTYTTSNIGAWYNYAAATAGSIAVASTTDEDVYNICPQGWTLPSNTQNGTLVTELGSDYSSFNPLYGGVYGNGSHNSLATNGNWWSTTALSGTRRRYLRYNSGSLSTSDLNRYRGYYVRCIMVAS